MFRLFIILLTFIAPSQAFAFNFGFVHGPDWMDPYLVFLVALTAIALGFTLVFKPRGAPFNQMYQHFGNFSLAGRIAYAAFGISFTILMVMVFVGMGLQRATEAGFQALERKISHQLTRGVRHSVWRRCLIDRQVASGPNGL